MKQPIDEGINGLGIGIVNTNSAEFKALQQMIQEKAQLQSPKEVLENKLLGLRFQMQDYLNESQVERIEVGWFLKKFLRELNIKNKTFAAYIGIQESNLSALFAGKRKINPDLALKLGEIFRVAPRLWIDIQSKNELMQLVAEDRVAYQKYNIDDLLKKAS